MWLRGLLFAACLVAWVSPAKAQAPLIVNVVTTCGTLSQAYVAGSNRPATQNVNGVLCSSSSGGGGGGAVTIADGADVAEGATTDAAATAGSVGTSSAKLRLMTTQLASILTAVGSAIPAGTANIGNVGGTVNVTPTDCSGTMAVAATAQNAFTAGATKHGFTIQNLSTDSMTISFTTTADVPGTPGSYTLNPSASGVAGGSYSTPFGFGMNTALSVLAATMGSAYSCTWW